MYLSFTVKRAEIIVSYRGVISAISVSGRFPEVAAFPEELLEQGGGFRSEEAAFGGDSVVEARIGRGVVKGTRVAGLGVGGRVDEAGEAGGVGCSGAHGAGFESRIEGAAGEAPGAEERCCLSDGEEFGVGCRIIQSFAGVGGDAQGFGAAGDYGSYRHLSPPGGVLGGGEGTAHHRDVGGIALKLRGHGADNSRVMFLVFAKGKWVGPDV